MFVPLILSAQNKGHIGFEVGSSTPLAPEIFKSYWNSAFNLGFVFDKPVSDIFSAGAEANYSGFALDNSLPGFNSDSGYSGGSFNISQLLAVGMISDNYSKNLITPYGKLGLGLSYTSVPDIITSDGAKVFTGSRETGLGVMLAAGLNFNLNTGNKITLEGSYRMNKRSGESFNSLLFDLGYCFGM